MAATPRDTGHEPPRDPVLADVAAAAGVSAQTVSRVVNGSPSVSAPTRERVQSAIDDLGYRPNPAARALVTRRTRTVGVITAGSAHHGPATTLLGVEEAARAAGYAVSVAVLRAPEEAAMREAVGLLRTQQVDGVVAITPEDATRAALVALEAAVPLVAADDHAGTDAAGARLAVEHLLALGHATVHHVSGPADWPQARARADAWRAALRAAGAVVPPAVVGDWSAASGHRAASRWLRSGERPTAVFAANDQTALGVVHALTEAGVDVPGDVSVVGYDDVPEAAFFTPPLTTVHQDAAEAGRRSVRALLALLALAPGDPGSAPPAAPAEPPAAVHLVVRRSTGRASDAARGAAPQRAPAPVVSANIDPPARAAQGVRAGTTRRSEGARG